MRGRVLERRVDVEPQGIASVADLAEVAYALGRHAELGQWSFVVYALERFLAATLERVFREAHIGLWEEYAAGDAGGTPVGVHLSLSWGEGDEVIVKVPGAALFPADSDASEKREFAKGLRALADDLDREADKQE